jgi:5-hydroxyisourate hydrolase-like protein (transthyretin family)
MNINNYEVNLSEIKDNKEECIRTIKLNADEPIKLILNGKEVPGILRIASFEFDSSDYYRTDLKVEFIG